MTAPPKLNSIVRIPELEPSSNSLGNYIKQECNYIYHQIRIGKKIERERESEKVGIRKTV